MRNSVLIAILLLIAPYSAYADNLIYMDQPGSNASININQDGSSNRVGNNKNPFYAAATTSAYENGSETLEHAIEIASQ